MRATCVRGILFVVTCALFLGAGQDVLAQELVIADPTGDAKTSVSLSSVLTLSPEEVYSGSNFGRTIKRRAEAFATQLAQENDRLEANLVQEEKKLTELRKTMTADLFVPMAALRPKS